MLYRSAKILDLHYDNGTVNLKYLPENPERCDAQVEYAITYKFQPSIMRGAISKTDIAYIFWMLATFAPKISPGLLPNSLERAYHRCSDAQRCSVITSSSLKQLAVSIEYVNIEILSFSTVDIGTPLRLRG
jgi:hypothetical protein